MSDSTQSVATRRAFFLVGPTAIGKTSVAHHIATAGGWRIISADSMVVYRGMDVGTAKPVESERATFHYMGIDLANPDEPFNVGGYLDHLRSAFGDLEHEEGGAQDRYMVVGGTGLYIKCLTDGLDSLPSADEDIRASANRLLEEKGIEALQARLREVDAARYEALADPLNARRLIRALELALLGATGGQRPASLPQTITGLRMPRDLLCARIEQRTRTMFEAGLVEEVRALRSQYESWSQTASQAIGYLEAGALLDGELNREEAIERTALRTRRLAKRQMTWLRNQADVDWIDITPDEAPEAIAKRVEASWSNYGPTDLRI